MSVRNLCRAFAMLSLSVSGQALAQAGDHRAAVPAAVAPTEREAIPLYGAQTPGSAATEIWGARFGTQNSVRNVTRPTLTPVLPDPATATGAGVIVAPGGGYMILSMESEGWDVARALADRGIAAFVLKYRLLQTPADPKQVPAFIMKALGNGKSDPAKWPTLVNPPATQDALAALKMVRDNAVRWRVDPARVGIIGFSAGAMTAIDAVLTSGPGQGPAFLGYVYGPQAAVDVPANAPPMFNAIALDDPLFPSMGFPIVQAWLAAKRPVEVHGYQKGSHGFGLGKPGTTTTLLMDEFTAWLSMQGFLDKSGK